MLDMKPLSLCYYPCTVVLVDDNEEHLEVYKSILERKKIHCLCYSNPIAAFEFLNNASTSNYWINFMEHNQTPSDSQNLLIDIGRMWQCIYSFDRFNDIGVACFDKQMPGKDGMEILNSLTHYGVRNIMMTGYHDSEDVTQLMVQGLIDAYIQKHDTSATQDLLKVIESAQVRYFTGEKHSSTLGSSLLPKLYNDLNFVALHKKLSQEHHIVEYYVMDQSGSTLMLDADGKAWVLAVFTPDDIDAYQFELTLADEEPSQVIKDSVTDIKQLPCFINIDRHDLTADTWADYLVSVRPGQGGGFYYAWLTDLEKYGIQRANIKSYKEFLTSI